MLLEKYRQKRNFRKTKEPRGKRAQKSGFSYVIQKHAARHLHYDFRLELNGVLLSWAVPKGPSLDPKVKRLAMHVEDHPVDYGAFEGTIAKGQYGGGTVMVWDRGTWEPEPKTNPDEAYAKGRMTFTLRGEKLHGKWHLVRSHGTADRADRRWLLFKGTDVEAETGDTLLEDAPKSAATGRTMDEIAKSDVIWESNHGGNGKSTKNGNAKKTSARPRMAARASARRKTVASPMDPMPATIDVQLAELVKEAPAGEGWLHEVKLDGYRIVARRSGKEVSLITRGGKDWTERMLVVQDAVLALPLANSVILDGEVVVLDSRGISNFQLLQNSLGEGSAKALVYVVFDLLYLNGKDIRQLPLEQRRELLETLLEREPTDRVRLSEQVRTSGPAFFAKACERKLEGIVSKRASEPYRAGRGHGWVKTKCLGRQEFVIGGYTNPGGSRSHLGALLVGVPETNGKGQLRYAGKVGTGFTERSLEELKARLAPLEQEAPAFTNPPRGAAARAAHWVKPTLLAEIEFTEVTNDGLLRHPTFRGLREDKPAREVKMEKPAPESARASSRRPATAKAFKPAKGAGVDPDFRLTNPDKVLYPESGYTKADVATYYATIAGHMFPHLGDRPLTLVRCPEGRGKACFFQKHAPADVGPGLRGFPIDDEGKDIYVAMESPVGLLSLTQLGVLEIHTWGSHTETLEKPDLLVFDLDPDPSVEWGRVLVTATALRERLEALELESWVKTTGGKGLHVCVPIRPRLGWEEVKGFCRGVAEAMVKDAPDAYVATASKAKRRGKIFVDYLRNARGATFIAPYSTRAREGAPVATPLSWSELTARLRPEEFTIETVPTRMKKLKKDPWSDICKCEQELTAKALDAVSTSPSSR